MTTPRRMTSMWTRPAAARRLALLTFASAVLAAVAALALASVVPSDALAQDDEYPNPYPDPYDVTVVKSPPDKGTVTGGGIDCGSDCTAESVTNEGHGYEPGFGYSEWYSIVLDAHPVPGYVLDRWEGCAFEGTSSCHVFSEGENVTVTAHFREAECADGMDNDSDGTVDYPKTESSDPPPDPDCESESDDSEAYVPPPDTTPPPLTVTPASIGLTNDPTPSVEFSSTEEGVSYSCLVRNRDYNHVVGYKNECTSPYTSPPLTDGPWQIEVYAYDAARNRAVENRPLTLDTTVDTEITGGPWQRARSTSASFYFEEMEGPTIQTGGRFECRLDRGSWSPCTAPKSYSGLSQGSHTFEVAATDRAGNEDTTPANRTWKVDTIGPAVTAVSPSAGATGVSPTANVFATFSEAMRAGTITRATVKLVRRGTTTAVPGTVSYDAVLRRAKLDLRSSLRRGATYTATVTRGAKDLAGNPFANTKSWSFTVRR